MFFSRAFFLALLYALSPSLSYGFGNTNAFEPKPLLTGHVKDVARITSLSRWASELIQRTSALANFSPVAIHADDPKLVQSPFLYWSGSQALTPLSSLEIAGLRRFFALGGFLMVEDETKEGRFLTFAKEQLARVLPEAAPLPLKEDHVIFRSFYLIRKGETQQDEHSLEVLTKGNQIQVLFSHADILGSFTNSENTTQVAEKAIRFAVNIAMYVLCSDYKSDQVHTPFLLVRRRNAGTQTK